MRRQTQVHNSLQGFHGDLLGRAPCIADETKTVSASMVKVRVNEFADLLIESGVRQGEVVAISHSRGADVLVAVLGILKIGAAFMCLDVNLHEDSRCRRIEAARAKAYVTVNPDGTFDVEMLPVEVVPSGESGDLAYVVFTSGTTGAPKAIGISNLAFRHYRDGILDRIGGRHTMKGKRVASVSSLSVDLGFTTIFLGLAYADFVFLPSNSSARDPSALCAAMAGYEIDVLKITPSHLREALRHADVFPKELLILGGERLEYSLLRQIKNRAPNLQIFNHYGPAETCVGVAAMRVDTLPSYIFDLDGKEGAPIGQALAGTTLRIVNNNGLELGVGEVGELEVEGPTVPSGYLNHSAKEASSFLSAGAKGHLRYRTGDLARFTDQGLEIIGRIDRQIKIDGRRVEPAGVEAVLRGCFGVLDCVVSGRISPYGSLSLLAWVIPEKDYNEHGVRQALRSFLDASDHPAFLISVSEFPRTPSGKVDIGRLPSPDSWKDAGQSAQKEGALALLLRHAEAIFGYIDRKQSFLTAGMQSLDALRLVSTLKGHGWELSVNALFCDILPAEIATQMKASASSVSSPREKIRKATVYEKNLWCAAQIAPANTYKMTVLLEVHGVCDPNIVAEAWRWVLAAQPSCRMRVGEGEPRLLYMDGPSIKVDVRHCALVQNRGSADGALVAAQEFLSAPLSLTSDGIGRSAVFPGGGQCNLIALAIHHLACDGVSVDLLIEALLARLGSTGDPVVLPSRAGMKGISFRGQGVCRDLSNDFVKNLNFSGQYFSVTPFTVAMAAWGIALSALNPDEPLLVGIPVSVREADEWNLVGYFVNTVVVDLSFDPHAQLGEYIRLVQARIATALEARKIPYARASQGLANQVGSLVTFEEYSVRNRGGVSVRRLRSPLGGATFPLDFCIVQDDSGCKATLYTTDNRVSRNEAVAIVVSFERIARRLAECKTTTINETLTLSNSEAKKVLKLGSGVVVDYEFRGLAAGIIENIDHRPEKRGLIVGGAARPLRILDERSRQWVTVLTAHGIHAGRVVAVDLNPGFEQMAALFAIVRIGGIPLPMDPAWPAERKRRFLSEASALISDSEISEGAILPPTMETSPCGTIKYNPSPGDVAYLVGTSGSTGAPKIIPLTHGGLCNHFGWMQRVRPLAESDTVLVWTTPCFDVGVWERFSPLGHGASVVILEGLGARDPIEAARMIGRHNITLFQTTPTLLRALCLDGGVENQFEGRFDIFCGGEPLTQDVVDAVNQSMKRACLHDAYGPAETTIDAMVQFNVHAKGERSVFSAIVDNYHIVVVSREGLLCDYGQPGLVGIAGPGMLSNYYGCDSSQTAEFVELGYEKGGRYFLTGDRAVWNVDGTLRLLGRVDRCIKVNGERMELDEVESVLSSFPGVRESAVTDNCGVLSAYVVTDNDITFRSLAAHLRSQLPSTFVPRLWARMVALPHTVSGKIDRPALVDVATAGVERDDSGFETELESDIATVWRDLLKRDCGPNEVFFDAGGNSLLLLRLCRALNLKFEKEVSIPDLFRAPTIRLQAKLLECGKSAPDIRLSDGGERRTGLAGLALRARGRI